MTTTEIFRDFRKQLMMSKPLIICNSKSSDMVPDDYKDRVTIHIDEHVTDNEFLLVKDQNLKGTLIDIVLDKERNEI